jgi:alkylation response protein AidB-like acyl-CoA dehydrogenase
MLQAELTYPLAGLSPHGRFEHGDLFPAWTAVGADATVRTVTPQGARIASKVGPFVNLEAPADAGGTDPLTDVEQALLHALPAWYLLGAAEEALDLATVYATERVQFGSPIAKFQGVAFPLADACSELQALYELGLFTMHRAYAAPGAAVVDALAFRWAA